MESEFTTGAIILKDYRNVTHIDRDNILGTGPIPEKFIPDISWHIQNFQGSTPTCGAHSGSHFKAFLDKSDTGVNRYSPMFLWRAIKTFDGFKPNQGTTIEAIMKALRSFGICDWSLLPSELSIDETKQAYTALTEEQKNNAQPRIIKSYAITYTPTHDEVKSIIYKDKVSVLLLQFDGKWWSGTVHDSNGTKIYGHFVIAYGYDKDYIYVIDSADAINPIKKLGKGFDIKAVGSAIDLPDEEIIKLVSQRSILQKLVELYRQLKLLLSKKS